MNELLYYNSIGLIPGPDETKQEFEERVTYCLQLKQDVLPQIFNQEIPESSLLKQALPLTQTLYGIQPHWVSLMFSNEKLAPWHGGAAWIFQMDEDSPPAALIQMRKNFFYKESYLGLLKRDELITHELSHIGRMTFDEPRFEEMLAYRSSESWIARTLGPLLQSSRESLLFLGSLFFIVFFDVMLMFHGQYGHFAWLKLIPFALIAYAFFRLIRNRGYLQSCLSHLQEMVSEEKANAILYRLTDSEIILFAKASIAEIKDYIHKQEDLRWQVIKQAYFS